MRSAGIASNHSWSARSGSLSEAMAHAVEEPAEGPRPRFGGAPSLADDIVESLLVRDRAEDACYDERLGYLLSIAAGWAYSDASTLRAKLAYYGLADATVEHISVVNDAMFIVAHAFFIRSACGRFGVVAFRGTEPANLISWLTDAECVWRPLDEGRVHAGFFGNVEALWSGLVEVIGAAASGAGERAPLRDLYVTGHSLGAAMAVLAAKRLLDEGEPFTSLFRGVYAFGQPMVGDAAFANACKPVFAGRYFRHTYGRDVVCSLPPRIVDEAFVHFGEHRVCSSTGRTWTRGASHKPRSPFFITPTLLTAGAAFFARRLSPFRWMKLAFSIDDHVPSTYVAASRQTLQALRPARPSE